jgi:hypothetical protein
MTEFFVKGQASTQSANGKAKGKTKPKKK